MNTKKTNGTTKFLATLTGLLSLIVIIAIVSTAIQTAQIEKITSQAKDTAQSLPAQLIAQLKYVAPLTPDEKIEVARLSKLIDNQGATEKETDRCFELITKRSEALDYTMKKAAITKQHGN